MSVTSQVAYRARRERLLQHLVAPSQPNARADAPAILLASGSPRSRNYTAWTYPFRASSHVLYLTGYNHPGAALWMSEGKSTLFVPTPDEDHELWHGPLPSNVETLAATGVDAIRPIDELHSYVRRHAEIATLRPQEEKTAAWLTELLGRSIRANSGATIENGTADARLADAMIATRLIHDEAAIAQIRDAAAMTAEAHRAGREATRAGDNAYVVLGAMVQAILSRGGQLAYGPIVTPHGEILHAEHHDDRLNENDLLLADVGAESAEGWASDVTRTWPVKTERSTTQREIHEVVLRAQRAAVAHVGPGVSYRSVHHLARRTIVAGLVELGILRGDVDDLDARGAGDLFFPHGVGHLLGLDVHDMEDLGDRAGYAPGRTRVKRFGEQYLRLDRNLEPGMIVTIEPGFYQVPAILKNTELTTKLGDALQRDVLAKYSDVRGIRLEDDVLVTHDGRENLTEMIPM
ncbi:MAG: aminopeptidase P family protein [Polyangiaceae bacterium]